MKNNILDYLDDTLDKVLNNTAVIDGERKISFNDMLESAKKLSNIINKKTKDCIRKPIAVFMDKHIEAVITDIGIIYSGNAYMNVDTNLPINRVGNILQSIEPELVITNNKYIDQFENVWPEDKIVNIDLVDFTKENYLQDRIDSILSKIIDTDPLCIINTSGSTGVPKGVMLNHRSFIDFTEWAMSTTGIEQNEVIGSLSPIAFDMYSFELCMMMALGSTIMIIPRELSAFPVRILQLLKEHKVTYISWVPTIMVNIANMDLLSKISLPDLKYVWFSGEVFPTRQLNYWRRHLNDKKFINLYGPIEVTIICTYYILDRELSDDEPVPIGTACKNTDIMILNDDDELCDRNEEGELCVRGSSLAMGYYNNLEKTAEVFVQNPLNKSYPEIIYRTGDVALVNDQDEIIYKGRKDTLIKHSGYRIELGEIEHVIINALKLVKNGCAVYDHKNKKIVFYYENNEEIIISDIRRKIGTSLPKYMIPTVFIKLDKIPRNNNGKIDRLKLKNLL